jgi:hypothetical protein
MLEQLKTVEMDHTTSKNCIAESSGSPTSFTFQITPNDEKDKYSNIRHLSLP